MLKDILSYPGSKMFTSFCRSFPFWRIKSPVRTFRKMSWFWTHWMSLNSITGCEGRRFRMVSLAYMTAWSQFKDVRRDRTGRDGQNLRRSSDWADSARAGSRVSLPSSPFSYLILRCKASIVREYISRHSDCYCTVDCSWSESVCDPFWPGSTPPAIYCLSVYKLFPPESTLTSSRLQHQTFQIFDMISVQGHEQ